MTAKTQKLMVFAHLGRDWKPCGQLLMTEENTEVLASSFAYGMNYARRPDALEIDPVSLSLQKLDDVLGKRLLPAKQLPMFGGIRDAAPDSWGRRVIETKLKVPTNSLPESQYLLHACRQRPRGGARHQNQHSRWSTPRPPCFARPNAPHGGCRPH